MAALLLYLLSTSGTLLLWSRFVQPLSRAAALVLLLLPLVFTGPALFTGAVYAPADHPFLHAPLAQYAAEFGMKGVHNGWLTDLWAQMIPWRAAVRQAWAAGEWPLWNPFILCGDILAASAQPAPYDPFNLLSLLIPLGASLTYSASMTFFLAGLSTFALVRSLRCSEGASLLAAAGFVCSAPLAFLAGWPLGRAWAVLPLVLFAAGKTAREPRLASGALLTVSFLLLIFAGHPETVLHVVAAGGAYGAFEAARHRDRAVSATAVALVAGVLALLLSAFYLWPFADAAPQTVEHGIRTTLYAPADFPVSWARVEKRALATLLPFFNGSPWGEGTGKEWDPHGAGVGAVILALAVAAIVIRPRSETWFFAALAVFALFAAFDAPPVAQFLHALPLFDIALNDRFALAAALALSVLAALALDAVPNRRVAAAVIIGACVCALVVLTLAVTPSQLTAGVLLSMIRRLAVADIAAAALVLLAVFVPRRDVLAATAIGALLLSRVLAVGDIYPSIPRASFYPDVPLLERIERGSGRIVGTYDIFPPGTAALYGLEDARGYQAMTHARRAETYPLWSKAQDVWFNSVTDLSRPFLSFLNVRYALAWDWEPPLPGWRRIAGDRGVSLYENERVLPRAFVPRNVRYHPWPNPLGEMSRAADFAEIAWVHSPGVPPHTVGNGPGELAIRRDGTRYTIDAVMAADGWIVLSETAWPGWRCYVDGQRRRPKIANHAFIAVMVPAGKHQLRVEYLPEPFTRGRNLSAVTALVLLGAGVRLWWMRRSTRRTPRMPTRSE